MKHLTLIRHAKSSWKDQSLDDIDRPLNRRGKGDAPAMGRRLRGKDFAPDLVVTSPARRARQTAKLIVRELKPSPSLVVEPSLYLADTAEILSLVRNLGNSLSHVVLVGHNPGMTELANHLGAVDIENVPTTGIVRFEIDAQSWSDVGAGSTRILEFDYPKKPG